MYLYLLSAICVIIAFYLYYSQHRRSQKWKKSLKGKIVLVTGSGNGLGKEMCIAFARENCHVICVDIDEKGNENTVEKIKEISKSIKVHAYTMDITNPDNIRELNEKILKEFPAGIDILVNNAGVAYPSWLLDATDTHIRRLVEINQLSHFWLIRTFLPKMIERDAGHIVGIASLAAIKGVGCLTSYCSSKFAVKGLMDSLACELLILKSNVKTLLVCPGFMDTKLLPIKMQSEGTGYTWLHGFPMKITAPEDVVQGIINSIKDERRIYYIPYMEYLLFKLFNSVPQFLHDFIVTQVLKSHLLVDELPKIN